ncbi:hypothetical protein QOT17_002168 [Balamuthia mandrillaris]
MQNLRWCALTLLLFVLATWASDTEINFNFQGMIPSAPSGPSHEDPLVALYKQRLVRSERQKDVVRRIYSNVVWPTGAEIVYDALWTQDFTVANTLFSEDVFIKLPPIGEFHGILANLEYFYGLAGPVEGGIPQSRRVTSVTFTHLTCWQNSCSYQALLQFLDFATDSIATNFTHHGTVFFNEEDKVCGGQINFVHQAINDIDPTDPEQLARHRQSLCGALQLQCTGANAQFESFESCMEFMSALPYGGFYHNDRNTTSCRTLHLALQRISPLSAERHCPHSGPSGGGKCISKTGPYYYTEEQTRYDQCKDPNF